MKILIFAILLRLFSNPIANVFQKKLTQNFGLFLVNAITYFGLFLLSIPFIFKTELSLFSQSVWMYGILGGLLGALGNAALVKALSLGDLSVLGPINAYKSVVTMFFGIFLLHEVPSIIGLFAIGLIIWGSYFVFDTVEEKFSLKLFTRKDIQYRILALVLTATEVVMIKKVILLSSVSVSFLFWCGFGFLFSFLFALIRREHFVKLSATSVYLFAGLILMFGIMQYSTNYVFNRMNTAYALAIFQLSSIISIFLGYKFFQETDILKKFVGTVIMVAGAVLIILL